MEPVAWKYEIAAYADHRTDVGVVLNKRELSSAVPAEQTTWTPLFAFDDRRIVGDAFRIADEAMMDMLMCHSLPDEAIRSGFGGVLALHGRDVATSRFGEFVPGMTLRLHGIEATMELCIECL